MAISLTAEVRPGLLAAEAVDFQTAVAVEHANRLWEPSVASAAPDGQIPGGGNRMPAFTPMGRAAAGILALVCWIALGIDLSIEIRGNGLEGDYMLPALWDASIQLPMLSTIFLAVAMTGVAAGVRQLAHPFVVGWAVVAAATVGAVYWPVGRGLMDSPFLSEEWIYIGLPIWVMQLIAPLVGLLFWLAFVPKGALTWKVMVLWSVWPVGYFICALAQKSLGGLYPASPFPDPSSAPPLAIVGYVCVLTGISMIWTLVLFGLDKVLRRHL